MSNIAFACFDASIAADKYQTLNTATNTLITNYTEQNLEEIWKNQLTVVTSSITTAILFFITCHKHISYRVQCLMLLVKIINCRAICVRSSMHLKRLYFCE
jgi:hypothetical protein